MKVACQGVEGAYSHQFAVRYLPKCDITFLSTFEDVARVVANGEFDCGVLPLENSTAGSVDDTYKLLLKYDLHIKAVNSLMIKHCLLGVENAKKSDIVEVSSHPQALMQCEKYIEKSHFKTNNAYNTAMASQELAKSGDITRGVIASKLCANLYGLDVIEECVQDEEVNYTRFVVITKELLFDSDDNRVSVVCRTLDERNSLSKLLACFGKCKINLTKIVSKSIPNTDFEVNFYIDFEGSLQDRNVQKLFSKLENKCKEYRILGVYKA